jgi:hypothetical protein
MEGDGETLFRHACKLGLEGIVSKRKDAAYRSGRSPDWAQDEKRRRTGRKTRSRRRLGEKEMAMSHWNWAHKRHEAIAAIIVPWDGKLGVSYAYHDGSAEAGPIGPTDWSVIGELERRGKLSFANKEVHERFLKVRGPRTVP